MIYEIVITPSSYEPVDCGETVTFTPLTKAESHQVFSGTLSWKIYWNSFELVASGNLDLAQLCAQVAYTTERPGMIRCEFEYCPEDGEKVRALAGIAVEPTKIQASTPLPEDFDAFWERQKARLAQVPVNAELSQITNDRVDLYDTSVACTGSAPVRGLLVVPKGAAPGSCPALVHFHGAGVRSARTEGVLDLINQGFMVFDINAHGVENCRDRSYYQEQQETVLAGWSERGLWEGKPEDCYYLEMFLRAKRAVEFLAERPEWDGRNLFVRGVSMGGFQSFAAAYLDERVSAISTNVAAGSDLLGGGWPVGRQILEKTPAEKEKLAQVAGYFDNVNFASRLRIPAFMGVGLIDETCKPDGVYAVYNRLAGEKTILADFDRGHAVSTPQYLAECAFLLGQVK
jgi:cephalosporin-C deacetylase-like acetyl esterase